MMDVWDDLLGGRTSEPSNQGEIHRFDQTHHSSQTLDGSLIKPVYSLSSYWRN